MTSSQASAPYSPEVSPPTQVCVAIPARNEAKRLPTLVNALAEHTLPGPLRVVFTINNSTDGSAAWLMEAAKHYRDRLLIRVDEIHFSPELSHAGSARRRVMDLALDWLDGPGVLLTTDADARPPSTWVAANLQAIAAGADMVGGRLDLDRTEPLPPDVARLRQAWDEYWAAVRAVEDEVDPQAWDLPPRHGDHTGGSLAVRADLYRHIGGVPVKASGEDRALVLAGLAAGGRLVHPLAVWTRVSPRLDGRAEQGMAHAMADLHATAKAGVPIKAPGLPHWRERALWRRLTRSSLGAAEMLRLEAALPPMPQDAWLMTPEAAA